MIPTSPPPFDMTVTIHAARIRRVVRRSLAAAGIALAPSHRADVPVDLCSAVSGHSHPLVLGARCHATFGGKHAAARVAGNAVDA